MSSSVSPLLADLPALSVVGRLDRLRTALPDSIETMVVSNPTNIRWLTGFTGSNGMLVVGADLAVLVTDARYATQAPEQVEAAGVSVRVGPDLFVLAAELLASSPAVGLEADHVSWSSLRRWQEALSDTDFVPVEGVVVGLRSVKDAGELARIEAAAALTDASLAAAMPLLRAGTTERELALALDDGIRHRGGSGPAYETIVASGPNAALPHARPSSRPFESGDLVVIDVGALVEGYRSDMTRTFVIGTPDAFAVELLDVVTRAQAAGVAAARPGIAAGALDAVCRDALREAGHGDAFGHGTGHGVGLDIHELPSIRRANAAILQPGQVITIEPGVYYPGAGGARVEDSVVITDTGCRPLTRSPKFTL